MWCLNETLFHTALWECVSARGELSPRGCSAAAVPAYTEPLALQLAAFLLRSLLCKEVEHGSASLAWQSQAANHYY